MPSQRRKQREIIHRRGNGSVILEAEIGVMQPQAKEGWQPPEAGRASNRFSPRTSGGKAACWYLDFGQVKVILDFWPPEL